MASLPRRTLRRRVLALIPAAATCATLLIVGSLVAAGSPSSASGRLDGTAGPIAWRIEDLQLERREVDGKPVETYELTMVLKNTGVDPLRITGYQASWSLPGIHSEEFSQALDRTLRPQGPMRIGLEALISCLGGTACRWWTGPTWTVVLMADRSDGRALREVIEVILPAEPRGHVKVVPKLSIRGANGSPTPAVSVVPVQVTSNLIVVPATANGHSIVLVLDTGAQMTVLNSDVAARLGLDAAAEAGRLPLVGLGTELTDGRIVILRSLRIGDHLLENLPVAIAPLPFGGVMKVDGLLGADLLDAFRVTIDRRQRQLRLELNR